jgi:HD-like signal output (HDOD) protein/prolyl-tRNA editing enzyme YbaK/EbsC (Cys-tRNA(Pro) deacylase)
MPVSSPILDFLQSRNIHFQLHDAPQDSIRQPAAGLVKSVLLKDEQGLIQALIPWNSMIDLDMLTKEWGRDALALPWPQQQALLAQQGLNRVPAIPQWQNATTLVDSQLLQHTQLWLETGDQAAFLEVKRDDFCSMIQAANVGRFTLPVPTIHEDPADDRDQIMQSLQRFTKLRIKQRLEDTLELPPLPDTARQIIRLRANANADISDLTEIVELDPSLAAQVVSWAASPYYSAPGKIKSVHDAIVRVLGFDMVLNLALGLALGKTLSHSAMSQQQLDNYWQQSVRMAAIVEGLVTSIPREHRPAFGMSYLAGLLSNFGELVLAEVFPPYFSAIKRTHEANPHIVSVAAEKATLGVGSHQIASWLLETWNMPREVILGIRQQFNPDYKGEHSEYAQLLFVAQQLLLKHEKGLRQACAIPLQIYERLHLSAETAEVTVSNVLSASHDLRAIAAKMAG